MREQYEKVCDALMRDGAVSVSLATGEIVTGSLFDIVSEDDDPAGVGYFVVKQADGLLASVSPTMM